MSRSIAANRVFNTFRIFSRSVCSAEHLAQSRHSQRLFKMETSSGGERQMSTEEPRRFARPDEVDYALKQDMGQGYTRRTVQISALGTKYNMVYGEWVPVDRPVDGCPAVICLHGTPATEGAFRPIGSRIASGGYRVLAVNFPGMGYTETDLERRYNHTTPDKAELVKGFIAALRLESVAMVIGHSLGGHVVGKLSADPDLEGIVQSACFLCGTGVTPHRLYKKINMPILPHVMHKMMYLPYIGWMVMYFFAQIVRRWGFRGRTHESQALCIYEVAVMNFDMKISTRIPYAAYIIYRALYIPVIGRITRFICSKFMHYMGLRGRTTEAQTLGIYEVYLMEFNVFAQNLMRIAERKLPVLLFFSLNDTVVESELLQENIDVLGIPDADIKDYDDNGQSGTIYRDGTLRRVVRFAAGTHRLQFTNPERTTAEIVSLLDALGRR